MMNPERDRNFDQNVSQLISALKKLLKDLPSQANYTNLPGSSKEDNVNVNLFLTFFSLSPEDYDELEELYDSLTLREEKAEELNDELTPSDEEFLRQNGIRF